MKCFFRVSLSVYRYGDCKIRSVWVGEYKCISFYCGSDIRYAARSRTRLHRMKCTCIPGKACFYRWVGFCSDSDMLGSEPMFSFRILFYNSLIFKGIGGQRKNLCPPPSVVEGVRHLGGAERLGRLRCSKYSLYRCLTNTIIPYFSKK